MERFRGEIGGNFNVTEAGDVARLSRASLRFRLDIFPYLISSKHSFESISQRPLFAELHLTHSDLLRKR